MVNRERGEAVDQTIEERRKVRSRTANKGRRQKRAGRQYGLRKANKRRTLAGIQKGVYLMTIPISGQPTKHADIISNAPDTTPRSSLPLILAAFGCITLACLPRILHTLLASILVLPPNIGNGQTWIVYPRATGH